MSARITVVLRYDDFSALSDTAVESELLGILRRTGLRAVFGVVPFAVPAGSADHLEAKALEGEKARMLREAVVEGVVEAALHGCMHLYLPRFYPGGGFTEFEGLTRAEQSELVARGNDGLENACGRKARTFIPPFNSYDELTVKALQDNGIQCLSAAVFDPVPEDAALRLLPHTCNLSQVREAVDLARRGASAAPVVAALFHQCDFADKGGGRAPFPLERFEDLARWLAEQADVDVRTAAQAMDAGEDLGLERHQVNRRLRRLAVHPLAPACDSASRTRTYYPDQGEARSCLRMAMLYAAAAYLLAAMAGFSGGVLAVAVTGIPGGAAAAVLGALNALWFAYLGLRPGRVYSNAARLSVFLAASVAGGLAT